MAALILALYLGAPSRATADMPPPPIEAQDPDESLWRAVDVSNPAELRAYLDAYPNGKHAKEARSRLGEDGGTPPGPVATDPDPTPGDGEDKPKVAEAITGTPIVLSAASLRVNGRLLPLFGVEPPSAARSLEDMRSYLKAQGNRVTCKLAAGRLNLYICQTKTGVDVARAVILNGLARASAEAPADYHSDEKEAKAKRRGIWQ